MKNNRRNFLKLTSLAGLSVVGSGLMKGMTVESGPINRSDKTNYLQKTSIPHTQQFNMSGFTAPKLDTVRIGFIGLGSRGPGHVMNMSLLEGVDIKALCDIVPEKAEKAGKLIEFAGFNPTVYSGETDAWKKLCERSDIDMVYICTPWNLHTPMAVYAMEHGKHVAVEVPAADNLDECWQLVQTSEKTHKHCQMMENCCYDFFELLTLNMARQGFFGDIVHCEGAYLHNLLESNFSKNGYWNMWRLRENAIRR